MKTRKINLSRYRRCADVTELEGCCGASELWGLDEGPVDAVIAVCQTEAPTTLVIFTDAIKYRHGARLAAYIRKQKLGRVVSSYSAQNPNTGNAIKGWIWLVDQFALEAWSSKHLEG